MGRRLHGDDEDGVIAGPGDAYVQARQALEQRRGGARAGRRARWQDVVRTRMFVTDISQWEAVGRAHGEVFADIRPVTAMLEVSALLDPRMMVEIEADALHWRLTPCPRSCTSCSTSTSRTCVERRAPHREGHLGLIKRWHDEGRIAMAGGVGDPPHAGLIVLREEDPDAAQAAAEQFVAEDPYQPAGLVTSWRVEPFLNVTD